MFLLFGPISKLTAYKSTFSSGTLQSGANRDFLVLVVNVLLLSLINKLLL